MGNFFGFPPPQRIPIETGNGRKRRRPRRDPDPVSMVVWLIGGLAFLLAFGVALTA